VDNLGLLGALELQFTRLTPAHCCVSIDAGNLPCLPAAVEVAAYRIAVEAVTNTVRHAAASNCNVRVTTDGETLFVDIRDNGGGTDPWTPGVGILSMREQARDLGGDLSCGPDQAGGTVSARLPLLRTGRVTAATTIGSP
jgi:signal transduction histidine kinase